MASARCSPSRSRRATATMSRRQASARTGSREPHMLDYLERIVVDEDRRAAPFRLPVQWVNRPHLDFRGVAGTIPSGRIRKGEAVIVAGSGRRSTVARILVADQEAGGGGSGRRRDFDACRRNRHRARRHSRPSRKQARSRRPVHRPYHLDERGADAAWPLLPLENRGARHAGLDHRAQAPARRQQSRQARREAPRPQRGRDFAMSRRRCPSPTTPMPKTARPAHSS